MMRIGVRRGTAPPAAELVLRQVVGGVNEEIQSYRMTTPRLIVTINEQSG